MQTKPGAISIQQLTPRELKARLDASEELFLLDVREQPEREICTIGGVLIPKDTISDNLDRIPRDKDIIVYCRSGGRSDWVARELVTRYGYTRVANLAGGVLRWSDDVDPSVTKY